MNDVAPSDYHERLKAAKLAAKYDGLGWEDLVVRYSLSQETAKWIVSWAEIKNIGDGDQ